MISPEVYLPVSAFVMSFFISYLSIPSIVKVANLKHLFDEPGERSVHIHKTPTLGGLAVFAGFSIAALLFTPNCEIVKFVVAAVIALFFVGIKDDILVIAPITKILGQVFAASFLVIFTDIQFTNLHGLFWIHEIPSYIGIPLTIFTIIVITNSFNLIDGIDGLAGSIGIVVSGVFGFWFYLAGHVEYTVLALALVGALTAYLRFNLFGKSNKIFMGDTGSLILGFIISVFVIKFNQTNIRTNFSDAVYAAPAISFAVLIVPLFDTVRVMFLRFFQGKPIFYPDKQHLHHLFLKLGFNHLQTDLILVGITLVFSISAYYCNYCAGIHTIAMIVILAAMILFYIPVLFLNRKKNSKK